MIIALTPCPIPRKAVMKVKHNYFIRHASSKGVLRTQTFNNRCSALTGAAITTPALAEPFIAAGAAVAFWYFFATEKGLSLRGYKRKEIIKCLVGTNKHKKICFCLWQRLFVSFVLKQKAPMPKRPCAETTKT